VPGKQRHRFAIDAPLPPSGPARYAVLAMLVLGGIAAILVPVFLAVVVYGLFAGPGP
jgi:hypothetical protein